MDAEKNLPRERWTIKTARLIEALSAERARIERIERFNERQNTAL
jgi:hypothetical protein